MTHTHRRRRALGLTAVLAIVLSIVGVIAANPASAAVVNPGNWNFQSLGGNINFAGNGSAVKTPVDPAECQDGINNDIDFSDPTKQQDALIDWNASAALRDPQCINAKDNSETVGAGFNPGGELKAPISVNASIAADGTMSNVALSFPKTYVYATGSQVEISVTQDPAVTPTGSADPVTGAVDMTLGLILKIHVYLGTPGIDCVAPLALHMTTASPGIPYDPATGIVTLADTTFVIPAMTPTNATACTPVNDGFGLPAASGASSIELRMKAFPTANTAPVANAGPDHNIAAGSTASLSGLASTDTDQVPCGVAPCATPGPVFYKWTQTAGPAVTLSDPTSPTPTFTAPAGAGVATTFQLQVNDGTGAPMAGGAADNWQSTDSVTLTTAANVAPIANAGTDQTVTAGDTVNLDGTGSSDPDNFPVTPITYHWTQTAGSPSVTITGNNTATPSFTAPTVAIPTSFTFQVDVGDGATVSSDTVSVLVNPAGGSNIAPTANAGTDQSAAGNATISLDGTGSTDGGDGPSPLTYAWTQTSGPPATITGANTATPSVKLPPYGCFGATTLTFQLTVNDGADSASDSVTVTLDNVFQHAYHGDYNTDGKAEQALFKPSSGAWYVQCYGSFYVPQVGGIPVAGEWVTSGLTNAAVYNPGTGVWRYYTGGFQTASFTFAGNPGDIPVPAKYNGSTTTVAAFYRPSTNQWIINGVGTFTFGVANAIPVPGDYDGNGTVDLAYYDAAGGKWVVANGTNTAAPTVTLQGGPGFIPVPGHYTGAPGVQKMLVKNGIWYLQGTGVVWSSATEDVPAVADYDGVGTEQIGVFRPSTQQFIWRPYNGTGFSKLRKAPFTDSSWRPVNTPWAITRFWGP